MPSSYTYRVKARHWLSHSKLLHSIKKIHCCPSHRVTFNTDSDNGELCCWAWNFSRLAQSSFCFQLSNKKKILSRICVFKHSVLSSITCLPMTKIGLHPRKPRLIIWNGYWNKLVPSSTYIWKTNEKTNKF